MEIKENRPVALYLRYSSDKQNEQSIEGQQRVCQAYCDQHGMEIVRTYVDRALSASKHTEKRENFMRMIDDSKDHEFTAVIVYKLDRFSRNRYDMAIYRRKLELNGVELLSATEAISSSPEGVLLESVLEGLAEFYSKELSQKVTRGMRETALKGNSCGGITPLGYKLVGKKYQKDPLTAPIVKEAFELYAQGVGVSKICQIFSEKGYKTSHGQDFNKNSFFKIFKNEKYTGVYLYNGIRIEGGFPQIISRDLFDAVQARRQSVKHAPAAGKLKSDYFLTGKLFCGHCGAKMTGEFGTSHSGQKYFYYTCPNAKRKRTCTKKPVPKDWIEEIVFDEAMSILNPESINELASMAVSEARREFEQNTVISALEEEIKSTQKAIDNLLSAIERGIAVDSLLTRIEQLNQKQKDLNIRLREEEQNMALISEEEVKDWLSKFMSGDKNSPEFRRHIVQLLISKITVSDLPDGHREVEIHFNLTSKSAKKHGFGSDSKADGPPLAVLPNLKTISGKILIFKLCI